MNLNENNESRSADMRLGKLPAKSSLKALLFSDFVKPKAAPAPPSYDRWKRMKAFPLSTFGNTVYGDCTLASQAHAAMRMEKLETGKLITIPEQSVIDSYLAMTERLYGGGDTGAYETDALDNFRREDLTFRSSTGHPITIDAYTKINQYDVNEVKLAIATTSGHGIKMCFNLPLAFSRMAVSGVWSVPKGQTLTGEWMPGSWGGHSTYIDSYSPAGVVHPTTWGMPDILITWEAVAAYCDESYWVIDSVDKWRKQKIAPQINLNKLVDAVNQVSSVKI